MKGFTLIELMIVVAIVGILSLFALSAYQNYTRKTYVSNGLMLTADIRNRALEYYSVKGVLADNFEELGYDDFLGGNNKAMAMGAPLLSIEIYSENDKASSGTWGKHYDRNVFVLHYDEKTAPDRKNKLYFYVYYSSENTSLSPSLCIRNTSQSDSIPMKYLPASCQEWGGRPPD